MRTPHLIALTTALLLVVGCESPEVFIAPEIGRAESPIEPTTDDDVEEVSEPISGVDTVLIAMGYSGPDDPTLLEHVEFLLSGSNLEAQPFYCPAWVANPHFTERGSHFQISGHAVKALNLVSGSVYPRARYRLPPGPWISDDEEWIIWSGYIDGWCHVRRFSLGSFSIWFGRIQWYEFHGSISSNTYAHSSTEVGTGDPFEGVDKAALDALHYFLTTGNCPAGWVIFIDDVRVC